MNPLSLLGNLGFISLSVPAAIRFRSSLGRVQETQARILREYLLRNSTTAFGQDFGFADIRSVEEYQARVPVSTYESIEGYIDRIIGGESNVLTREPVKLLEWSSGSTRPAKLIPVTASLQAEFRRAVGVWMSDLFRDLPSLAAGPAYWSISPRHDPPGLVDSTIPIGFLDDSQYLGGSLAPMVSATMAVPGAVGRIRDHEVHRRATLLHLLGCRDLRLMSVWHPTFLTVLMDFLINHWDDLLGHLSRGLRLDQEDLTIPPHPERARELASLSRRSPGEIWPHLGLISCWADGPARHAVSAVVELFPGVRVQGKGLLATEGVVTVPFGGTKPLAITSHFYEFLDGEERALAAWELENGAEYSVLLTTGGGLYRYRVHDQVRVTSFLGGAPCLEFISKEDHISDLFGEKLSQGFVQDVIQGLLGGAGFIPSFALLAPERNEEGVRYVLFLGGDQDLPGGLSPRLESALGKNPHYAHAVDLGQLKPAVVVSVGSDSGRRYLERISASGQRLGDVKPVSLSPLEGWLEVLGGNEGGDDGSTPRYEVCF